MISAFVVETATLRQPARTHAAVKFGLTHESWNMFKALEN
jgi:hypothetical protein